MNEIRVWHDEPADGPTNMAADEVLAAEAVNQNRPLVRFYRWSEMTFSLGGFQRLAQARAEPTIAALPLVRRPSGGGGIVHGTDLTYAVAVPRDHPWGNRPQVLYDAFHEALAHVLRSHGISAELHSGHGPEANDEDRLFCFDRRAMGDIVVPGPSSNGHKLCGSAQRRLKFAVLQHGSLLLDTPHPAGNKAAHPGLLHLYPAAQDMVPGGILCSWMARLSDASAIPVQFMPGSFAAGHTAEVSGASTRFRDIAWLARR